MLEKQGGRARHIGRCCVRAAAPKAVSPSSEVSDGGQAPGDERSRSRPYAEASVARCLRLVVGAGPQRWRMALKEKCTWVFRFQQSGKTQIPSVPVPECSPEGRPGASGPAGRAPGNAP